MSESNYPNEISPFQNAGVVAGHSVIQHYCNWETFRNHDWNLIAMVSGEGTAKIGTKKFTMKQGTFYIFAPMEKRRFYSTECWISWWIHFSLREPLEWPELSPGELYALTPAPVEFRRCLRDVMEGVQLAMGYRAGWQQLALSLVHNVIMRGNMLSHSTLTDKRLLKAETLLNDFENPMDMDQIAAACGMSRSIFYVRFRDAYGLPPRTWRERGKLNAVRLLLETTSLPLADICSRCGIHDMSQFFKRFKHCFGITPTRCREQFRLKAQSEYQIL